MKKWIYTILLMAILTSGSAQLPLTDVYLTTLLDSGLGMSARGLSFLSNMNPNGYNNQPAFGSPNVLYLTTDMYDGDFTEIVKLDLLDSTYSRVTQTDSISEYSPTPLAIDGHLSCVRVEKDGKSQTLRAYPLDYKNNGYRLFDKLDNIGYHHWLSETEVALFLVTTPFSLVISDIETNAIREVATDIGRCLKQDKDGNIIYVHKIRPDLWYLKRYDPLEHNSATICQTLPESEDFVLLNDGSILMGNGSALYIYNFESGNWAEIADFYDYGIHNIKRLAVSMSRLVIINNREI